MGQAGGAAGGNLDPCSSSFQLLELLGIVNSNNHCRHCQFVIKPLASLSRNWQPHEPAKHGTRSSCQDLTEPDALSQVDWVILLNTANPELSTITSRFLSPANIPPSQTSKRFPMK